MLASKVKPLAVEGEAVKKRSRRARGLALIAALSVFGLVAAGCSGSAENTPVSGNETGTDTASTEAAETYVLRLASPVGPTTAQSKADIWWADEIEARTNGRVKVEFFYQESLVPATDILFAAGSGRIELGYTANAYHPSELPLSAAAGIPFSTKNAEAQVAAFTRMYEENEDFRNEWTSKGVEVLHFHVVTSNIMGTNEPVESLDWFQGKQVRSIGLATQAISAAGASPISISVAEVYESMQRGLLDAYSSVTFEVFTDLGLHEVSNRITDFGLGTSILVATVVNADYWNSMPEDLRAIIREVDAEFLDNALRILGEVEVQACKVLLDSGGSVAILDEGEVQTWRDRVGSTIDDIWLEGAGPNGEEFLAQFRQILSEEESRAGDFVTGVERCLAQQ